MNSFPRGRRITAGRGQLARPKLAYPAQNEGDAKLSPAQRARSSEDEPSGRRLAAVAAISGLVGVAIGRWSESVESTRVGPYPLFIQSADLAVGNCVSMRFFEPRYRWMCRQILAGPKPYYFGFVTAGVVGPGSAGVLCEMLDVDGGTELSENFDGTFNVAACAVSEFTLVEVYAESVPSGPNFPPLNFGYVDFCPRCNS